MKLCKVENLKGNEIIARTVMTIDYTVLLSEGTVVKKEYIEKLKELGIKDVYIQEESLEDSEAISILKADIQVQVKEKVSTILGKHMYHKNKELEELSSTADNIIINILEEKEVVEKIYDIKERSADIYEHSISVCSLSTLIAVKMGFDQKRIHDISVGSLLHDIGLRYLTIDYENKKISEMDEVTSIEYKKHPIYGFSALRKEIWISEIGKNIILYHHENLDGSGYPLRAREIPIEAKIVGTCDVFDEMICGIGCERVKVYEAVEFLKTFKGLKYDKEIVDMLLQFTAVYPVGTPILTNENEEGVVIRQNNHFPDRPVLRITKDKYGNTLANEVEKDLLHEQSTFIEKVIN